MSGQAAHDGFTVHTQLRMHGETVVCSLPGHESEIDEFQCDRELLELAGQWIVKAIENKTK